MIENPGFETFDPAPNFPGLALHWTETTLGTGEDTAEWAGDLALPFGPVESFEHGWTATNPQNLITSLGFEYTEVERFPVETMSEWIPNLLFFGLSLLETAGFDSTTEAEEDFEDHWGLFDPIPVFADSQLLSASTDDFTWSALATTLGSSATGLFGGSPPEQRESFNYTLDGDPALVWASLLT